jgi:hypothetical protein
LQANDALQLKTEMMVETRRAARHRVLKAAKICLGAGTIDCTVRNLSSSGAALEVSNQVGIPEKFTLAVPGDGLRLPCHVAQRMPDWRDI